MGRAEQRDLSQSPGTGFTTEPWQWRRRPGFAPPVRVPPGERGAWVQAPPPALPSLLPGPHSPLAWKPTTTAIHFHPIFPSPQNSE